MPSLPAESRQTEASSFGGLHRRRSRGDVGPFGAPAEVPTISRRRPSVVRRARIPTWIGARLAPLERTRPTIGGKTGGRDGAKPPMPATDDALLLALASASQQPGRTIDPEAAQRAAADLLRALGADLDDEQLRDTPRRMAQAYGEL